MATIKSYTDLPQSKKLAEILPLESADMCFVGVGENTIVTPYLEAKKSLLATFAKEDSLTPCWSLAALLDMFNTNAGLAKDYDLWFCYDNGKSYCTRHYSNAIDACYEMILKLHELKLL